MRKKITTLTIIFSIVIGAIGFWFYQKNVFSKDILKLEILGPREAIMGDEIEYAVRYKNNGKTALEEPRLIFVYPENSLSGGKFSQRIEQKLEDIYPGEERIVKFKAVLLGKESELKEAKAELSFRPKNLKAFYSTKTSFTTEINFVPITLEFDLPSKLESGRSLSFYLNYFSNSNFPLSNLGIKIEYPNSFEFAQSSPKTLGDSEWQIPFLNKAGGGRITISGKIFGEQYDQQTFNAQLGLWQDGQFVLLKETNKNTEIVSPSLYISQKINNSDNYLANAGDLLHYEVSFKNVGDSAFQNLFLVVRLDGDAYDLDTLRTIDGEFKKGDKSIVWDSNKAQKMKFLGAGEENKIEFWVNLKDSWPVPGPSDKNPFVKDQVILGQAKEEFVTKINSKLEIAEKGFWNQGPIQNSGPFPPIVGQDTTFAISWKLINYYNDVKNVKVKALLPDYVNLTGEINPKDSRLTFDQNSREIVWEAGDLSANDGVANPSPEIIFQIRFRPSFSQRGQIPLLLSNVRIVAEDAWTQAQIEIEALSINTRLQDGAITDEMARVR